MAARLCVKAAGLSFLHDLQVLQWVSSETRLLWCSTDWANGSLDFRRVDDSSKIRVGHDGSRWTVSRFLVRIVFVVSKDFVELFEGRFSPDDETTNTSSRGKLEKVQSRDMAEFNSRNVSECRDDGGNISVLISFFVVDNKRTLLLGVSLSSGFSFTSTDVFGGNNTVNVIISTKGF